MKLLQSFVAFTAVIHAASAHVVPEPDHVALDARVSTLVPKPVRDTSAEELWKRKGGGGGGKGGGGGGGPKGGGGGSTSSTPKGGGSPSSGGGTGGSPPRGSTSSNAGGQTVQGSGPRPAYGNYYAGGATQPYKAGASRGGITPAFVGFGAVGFLGAAYLYGAYSYPYHTQYYYHNKTTNRNETKPVECICPANEPCTCEDNGNKEYFERVIGDGSYENLNKSLVTVYKNESSPDNQTTILLLGGVPNGTTAAGGTEDAFGDSAAVPMLRHLGWWPAVGTAVAIVLTGY